MKRLETFFICRGPRHCGTAGAGFLKGFLFADDHGTARLRDCGSRLLKYFSFVSICKYLLTAGLREQAFNVTQLWPGILKFSQTLV